MIGECKMIHNLLLEEGNQIYGGNCDCVCRNDSNAVHIGIASDVYECGQMCTGNNLAYEQCVPVESETVVKVPNMEISTPWIPPVIFPEVPPRTF